MNQRLILVPSTIMIVLVAYDQSHWWSTKEDYSFGWLVPIFTLYVIHDRWATARAVATSAAGEPRNRVRSIIATLGFIAGCALFSLGAISQHRLHPLPHASMSMTAGMVIAWLASLYLSAAAFARPGPLADLPPFAKGKDASWQFTTYFMFPALIWICSSPLPLVIEQPLTATLMTLVANVVRMGYPDLAWIVAPEGLVTRLPAGGLLIVAPECSGLRSLTAVFFAGSFLGAVYLQRLRNKVLLVSCAAVMSVIINLARALILAAIALARDPQPLGIFWHDVVSYSALGVGCAALLLMVPIFTWMEKRACAPQTSESSPSPAER